MRAPRDDRSLRSEDVAKTLLEAASERFRSVPGIGPGHSEGIPKRNREWAAPCAAHVSPCTFDQGRRNLIGVRAAQLLRGTSAEPRSTGRAARSAVPPVGAEEAL